MNKQGIFFLPISFLIFDLLVCTETLANVEQRASIVFYENYFISKIQKGKKLPLKVSATLIDCPGWMENSQCLIGSENSVTFQIDQSGYIYVLVPLNDGDTLLSPFPERTDFRRYEKKHGIGDFTLISGEKSVAIFSKDSGEQVIFGIFKRFGEKGQIYRFNNDVLVIGFSDAYKKGSLKWSENDGEQLHNGIRLPSNWPPMIDPYDESPMQVPYLDNPPEVINIDLGRQLFVDDFLIEKTDLKRVYHKPVKYEGNPVLKPETELETVNRRASIAAPKSGAVWWDSNEKIYRMWYEAGWFGTVAMATSRDGIHWTRPSLDINPGTNQVLPADLTPDSWTVVPDWENPDSSKRWTMYLSPPIGGSGTGWSLTSADGIHWNDRTPTGIAGDRSTHFYNPFRKKWVYSLRVSARDSILNRARLYYECDDFMGDASWSSGDKADWLKTDSEDPVDYLIRDHPQLYNFDAVAYESIMLGMFQILHGPDNKYCKAAGLPKITELMFAYSRDGFYWHRPDRRAHIAAERHDVWDRGYVQSLGNICTIDKDKLYIYYAGFQGDESKSGKMGMYERGATGLAVLRRDGFVSVNADDTIGKLQTRPITFAGKYLFVNAALNGGALRAEIQDVNGQPVYPFVFENSLPFTGDSTLEPLRWSGGSDLSSLSGTPVRICFSVSNGALYSFWVSADDSGKSKGYVAGGGPGYTGPTDTVGRAVFDF